MSNHEGPILNDITGTEMREACIPTKTIINSGRVLTSTLRATEFGITGVEMPRMNVDLLRHRKGGTCDQGARSRSPTIPGSKSCGLQDRQHTYRDL
jgi:probable pyridine nucleotide-disulfide oxidoreductase